MNRRPRNLRRAIIAFMLGMLTTVVISWLAMFLPWDEGKWYGPHTNEDVGVA